jgi:glycosyltransferase involved in cell wall biosynthesis
MKIALVADHLGSTSSTGTPDLPLAAALAARGHQVTTYTGAPGRPAPAGVEVVGLGPDGAALDGDPLRSLPDVGGRLAARWAADPPDVIHALTWTSGLAALSGARDRDIPLVQTFDGPSARGSAIDDGRRVRMEAAIARSAALMVARCTAEVADLTGLGVPRAGVTVIPCGVDVVRFTPRGGTTQGAGRQRVIALGAGGGYAGEHGTAMVVRAMRRAPHAQLLIVGGPDPADPSRRPAVGWDATARVQRTGPLAPADLADLLRGADVAVCAATHEPSAADALAAMACGVPLLATAVDALADVVAEGATGELVAPRQPQALAAALHDLLGDPTRLAGYRLAATDRAHARYAWEQVAADTEAAYQRVAAQASYAVA